MDANTLKFVPINILSPKAKTYDGLAGLTIPPTVTLSGYLPYVNSQFASAADYAALLSDGDQDLPLFFDTGTGEITLNFGDDIAPTVIALINHNCYDTDDHITIDVDGVEVIDIESPNRSVDLFYPLRNNDAWYNLNTTGGTEWIIRLIKDSGLPYLGELVIGFRLGTYEIAAELSPSGISYAFNPRESAIELGSGARVNYDVRPPEISVAMNFPERLTGSNPFIEYVDPLANWKMRSGSSKSLLVWHDDRVCMWGRMDTAGSYSERPGTSGSIYAPSYKFTAELARRFYRDGMGY